MEINVAQALWDKLSRLQKIFTITASLVVAIMLFGVIFLASRPQYVAIFTNITDQEAGVITAKLRDLKVTYQLEDDGLTILVSQKDASEVRLQIAKAGLPPGAIIEGHIHQSEVNADRKLRYILELQNELETALQKRLTGVQNARVHIVMPDESLFVETDQTTTAKVTLNLTPGFKLADGQIEDILNLLSASVEGLLPENVTIIPYGSFIPGINPT